ncbi:MAG TPA: FHA domain-containing protein [Gemmatimonadaceae bacterium]|nr:FHA domain-containing protein [Gemmatimonadaceae bacterium]
MSDRLIFEVLDGHARVASRTHVDELPATIGRGFDNSVVLDDPYVCPTHVRIDRTETGELVVEDVGSVNGLYATGDNARVAQLPLRHGTRFRIGRTVVRYHDPREPVPPTLVEAVRPAAPPEAASGRLAWIDCAWLASGRARAAVIVLSFLFLTAMDFTGVFDRSPIAKALTLALGFLVLLVVWAGIWALATRVVSQRFAFARHLAFAWLIAVAFVIWGNLEQWMSFVAPAGSIAELFTVPLALVLGVVLIAGHLGIASSMPRKRRLLTSLAVTGGVTAIVLLFGLVSSQEFTTKMDYEGQLKPMPARFVPAESLNEFATDARALRVKVDKMKPDTAGAQ